MFESLAPRWRRLANSLAYSALVALVVSLGYLTYRVSESRRAARAGNESQAEAVAPMIELGSFSARTEKSSDAARLVVSLRLHLTARDSVDCYVYVVARNEHVSPRLWAVWPADGSNAVTTGGHFRGSTPPTGEAMKLTSSWARLTAVFSHQPGQPSFDTVTVYVVSPLGEVLLAHPFAL